ncbi:hypothetical protein Tco_0216522, partial [Tanacetum coccineum]
ELCDLGEGSRFLTGNRKLSNEGTDIQEQDQKESQNQTKPSTEWKGQSQRSTK